MLPAEALRMSRLALGATAMEKPSSWLLKLIQSGKLLHVGHAIPREIGKHTRQQDDAFGTLLLSETGGATVVNFRGAGYPPKLTPLEARTRQKYLVFVVRPLKR